jgi:hypothetical protein
VYVYYHSFSFLSVYVYYHSFSFRFPQTTKMYQPLFKIFYFYVPNIVLELFNFDKFYLKLLNYFVVKTRPYCINAPVLFEVSLFNKRDTQTFFSRRNPQTFLCGIRVSRREKGREINIFSDSLI